MIAEQIPKLFYVCQHFPSLAAGKEVAFEWVIDLKEETLVILVYPPNSTDDFSFPVCVSVWKDNLGWESVGGYIGEEID